uniref:Protein kinase domain-containing protein n=1 Tax=Arcella intermedia TaxID=1963864 RepID=A0A6B2L238_9EUKA
MIVAQELELKECIGQGACGSVWKGLLRGTQVAVKQLKTKYENADQFKGEVAIMTQLRHPNVILFMGACVDPPYIVTEYLEGGDLQDCIKRHRQMVDKKETVPIKDMIQISLDIAKGMAWLHQFKPKAIIHKDLKPTNIMLDSNGRAKIIDFGLSEVQKQREMENRQFAGSACWMSPEMLKGVPYTEKLDVFAYGIILWQIFTSSPEVYDVSEYKSTSSQASFNLFIHDIVDNKKRPEIPSQLRISNEPICALIESSWNDDPEVRPSFTKIIDSLTPIFLNSVLKDTDAIQMWKKYFPDKDSVPFDDLFDAIWETTHKRELDKALSKKCLEAALDIKNSPISIDKFGLVLHWYGPLLPIGPTSPMLEKIQTLLRFPWFHPHLSGKEAEAILSDGKSGEYLIRCSLYPTAPFTMSRIESRKNPTPCHHRITYNRTTHKYKMQFQKKKNEAMDEIIGETLEEFVRNAEKALGLKKCVICKKYAHLFVSEEDTTDITSNYKVASEK